MNEENSISCTTVMSDKIVVDESHGCLMPRHEAPQESGRQGLPPIRRGVSQETFATINFFSSITIK
jgi:hypothetical protein